MADETPKNPWYSMLVRFLPINWRALVAWAAVALVTLAINFVRGPDEEKLPIPEPPVPEFPDGWFTPTEEDRQNTLKTEGVFVFSKTPAAAIGDDENTDAPLWRFYAKQHNKPFPARNQGQIGSCVSFGFAGAIETTLASQAALKRGPAQIAVPDVVQEVIYGGSRVDANGGRVPFNGDGSTGAFAVKWLSTGGIIARGKYGVHNLEAYSVDLCRKWGQQGVPSDIKPECVKNLCKYALVRSADEARKALQQGYAISVCSSQGFNQTRDSEGFLQPQGTWMHCMFIAGYRGGDRKGFLIVNSWGADWVRGPKGSFSDIPDGSFWAEPSVVDRMLKQEDSFAISGVGGFARSKIKPEDWIVHHKHKGMMLAVFAIAP